MPALPGGGHLIASRAAATSYRCEARRVQHAAGGSTTRRAAARRRRIDVEVSSASHPFWTGQGRVLDTAGRVEKFERRYGRRTR